MELARPKVAVIDSIQTIYSEALSSAPGSVAQVRECAAQLTRLAKSSGISIILVGHVTKEGNIAGPRVLEHMVDTVLYFEGDTQSSFRLIRAIKNRFGAVNELGVFAMSDKGLKGVNNPSALFLSPNTEAVPGACVLVTQEGSRPLLVEIQALVDSSHLPNPRRLAVGLEQNRLAMLLAVMHRHAGIACFDQDVFLNAVGGVKITEPAADLAVLLAIQSSLKNKALPKDLVVFGEVGLAGEIRPCPRGQERLREASKLGFKKAIMYDSISYRALDNEILDVFKNTSILYTPKDLMAGHKSISERLKTTSWPTLNSCLGKVIFILDGDQNDMYQTSLENGEERPMFTFSEPGKLTAAFIKRNNPIGQEEVINNLTNEYIVRTRSDVETMQARSGDYSMFNAAIYSNAQIISTDYYREDPIIGSFKISLDSFKIISNLPFIFRL